MLNISFKKLFPVLKKKNTWGGGLDSHPLIKKEILTMDLIIIIK